MSKKTQPAPTKPPSATEAARKLMKYPGYIVAGIQPGGSELCPGTVLSEFAGHALEGGRFLEVQKRASRAEWDKQVKLIFGSLKGDKTPHERGQRFYRCLFVCLKRTTEAEFIAIERRRGRVTRRATA